MSSLLPFRLPCLGALALAASLSGLGAGEAGDAGDAKKKDFGKPNQDYLQARAELEKMLQAPRDTDLYELSFQTLEIDRILLKDRTGHEHVFHYVTFRLRNEITDDTKQLAAKATRYNEILQEAAKQYEAQKAVVENAVTLTVAGEKVLDRQDVRSRARRVSITAMAYDENGSRFRLLDEPIGSGPQENFNFPDLGVVSNGSSYDHVVHEISTKVGRTLKSVDDIRKLELPPYNPAKKDEEGVAEGEVFGVLVFNRLSIHGDEFTFQVRGLSNKLRTRKPDAAKGALDNYLETHVWRRVYVMHFSRPGDENFEDLHRFTLTKAGWEWVDTFQRINQRASVAYVKYFMDNLVNEKGERNATIEDEVWKYYDGVREARPTPKAPLPDLKQGLKER